MESFQSILLVILFLILGTSIWNILLLRKIKARLKKSKTIDDKELYFDLKYKIQLITTIFSIIIAVLTFFGVFTYDKVNSKISEKINEEFSKHDELYRMLDVEKDSLIKGTKYINRRITENAKNLTTLSNEYNRLSQKDILKNNIIIVSGLYIDFPNSSSSNTKKIYYKDLITINNQKVPNFKIAPTLNILPTSGGVFNVLKITEEYFVISSMMFDDSLLSENEKNKLYFDVWIITKE